METGLWGISTSDSPEGRQKQTPSRYSTKRVDINTRVSAFLQYLNRMKKKTKKKSLTGVFFTITFFHVYNKQLKKKFLTQSIEYADAFVCLHILL